MLGAGASVSAGIPDFRTPGTGLYDNLEKYKLPVPEAVFDIGFFQQKPDAFYLLCRELWPGKFQPTPTHYFCKLLHDKGKLRRVMTQNIDSLERVTGLPTSKVVAAHGNFDGATCITTGAKVDLEEVREAVFFDGSSLAPGKGWRGLAAKHGGLVKPDIVFFGEAMPEAFFLAEDRDLPQADLLLVAGTSLLVHPFAGLVTKVKPGVRRALINRERVGEGSSGCTGNACALACCAGGGLRANAPAFVPARRLRSHAATSAAPAAPTRADEAAPVAATPRVEPVPAPAGYRVLACPQYWSLSSFLAALTQWGFSCC